MQKLRKDSGSGVVTIPKKFLEKDDVISDDEVPEGVAVDVERLGRRSYAVRISEDGDFPDLQESEIVERLAAQRLFDEGLRPGSAD
ncbi:hypothetical protein [Halobellus inordinatus]|uniref:hypothetical protein n=1 Tax=Halobellus inordinatus TaxID=1126236 RepID=UPI00210CC43C|nr:hypothetical protein [Halobellus inordinatus]